MKPTQAFRGFQPVQKGFEFGVVCVVVLRINLPDKGFSGPNGPHQRVFSAHKVEVAGPKHVVKTVLVGVGQGTPLGPLGQIWQRFLYGSQRSARRDHQVVRCAGELGQQLRESVWFVAKQTDQNAIFLKPGGMLFSPSLAL